MSPAKEYVLSQVASHLSDFRNPAWRDLYAQIFSEQEATSQSSSLKKFWYMIKALRKRHLQVWTALAVLLPIGIIAAAIAVPKQQYDKLLQPESTGTLPVLVKTNEMAGYTVNLRCSQDKTSWQLEWNNKSALTYPSALIYQVDKPGDDISNALLIGRIDGKGTFRFAIRNATNIRASHFVLYDIIHHRQINTVDF